MFKKGVILSSVFLILLSLNVFTFGQDVEYVDIINPEVSGSGKVLAEKNLFISIFIKEDEELLLNLVKVQTPTFNFESYYENLEFDTSQIENIEEKVLANEIENIEYSKEDIFNKYDNAQKNLKELETKYSTQNVIIKTISLIDFDAERSEEYMSEYEKLYNILKDYNIALSNFNYWEKKYLSLFEKVIINDVYMDVDLSLPYFEYNINNIEPGTYKLIVKLKKSNEIVKKIEFDVVTEKILVDEITDNLFKPVDFFENIINSGDGE